MLSVPCGNRPRHRFEPRGRGNPVDGEPGQPRVLGALDQRKVVVRLDFGHLRVQGPG